MQPSSRQRRRLRELSRDPDLRPRERDRMEMYLLSADGMRVPQLAVHFGVQEATLWRWIRQWEAEGLKAVRHKWRGLGPVVARRQAVRRTLNGPLSQTRSWTAAQLAEALATKGLVMKPRTVRKYLQLMGSATCAPSTSCATPSPPGDGLPRVVVLDNASTHTSRTIREAAEKLEELGIQLWYLPPYSPQLNASERTFRRAKHEGMPRRIAAACTRPPGRRACLLPGLLG